MVLSGNTYYQGNSAITAMYQGDVLVYSAAPVYKMKYHTTGNTKIYEDDVYEDGWFYTKYRSGYQYRHELSEIVILEPWGSHIGEGDFKWCTNLSAVTMHSGVTVIQMDAFYYDNRLTSITFEGTVAQWQSITQGCEAFYYVPATVHCTDGDTWNGGYDCD